MSRNLSEKFDKLYPEFHFTKLVCRSYSWNTNTSDEVNTLLNYGYAIPESEVWKYINSVDLDPTVGFLHGLAAAKTPLAYDVQELVRWLVDLSVLQILEEKNLKKLDFIVTNNYHLRLKPSTAKMLIEKIRVNLNTKMPYKYDKKYSYQSIVFDCVQQLANFIVEKQRTLQFTIPNVEIQRTDPLELRHNILTLSPAQLKSRGINKSTLWYQKKNLALGKRIRIYNKTASKLFTANKKLL